MAPRRYESRSAPAWRGGSVPRGSSRSFPRGNTFYNSGSRFFGQGRIQRIVPYHGGYRLFLDGWGYPFFIPYDRFRLYPFRLGLFIRLGAFYDPLGFYSVYDYGWPPYGYGYGYAYPAPVYSSYGPTTTYSANEVRGVVESIDLPRGEMLVDDDLSRQAVTVVIPRDGRFGDVHEGDYVDVTGSWNRTVFEAHRLDRVEQRR